MKKANGNSIRLANDLSAAMKWQDNRWDVVDVL
jgi:hypothetical protein